jgi:tRNA (guanine37-N1)-methyltransferase
VRVDVVTIFPEYLAPLELSLIGRARRAGLIDVVVHDLRDFTHDRHRTVDDAPMGGGAGMVMRPEPWGEALEHVLAAGRAVLGEGATPVLVVPAPAGEPFRQATARELAGVPWLVVACGRYEGIDERVLVDAARTMPVRAISLGDYVLNGGEVAALVVVEAVGRLLPGVLGNADSLEEESHEDGLLEYPVYTRPATWRGLDVPTVLLSGHHGQVRRWRRDEQLRRTATRRPDLVAALDPAALDRADLALLAELGWQPGNDGRLSRRLVPDGPAVAD